MNLTVTEVRVYLTDSADEVVLITELPCPFVAAFLPSQPPLRLEFKASYNTGVDYCRNIGFEPEVINLRGTNE